MPTSTYIDGDLQVGGALKAGSLALPSNSVGDTEVKATAPLGHTKYKPRDRVFYQEAHGTAVASKTVMLLIAHQIGTIVSTSFKAALKTACAGAATVVLVLKKNGVSITSGSISFDSGDANYDVLSGTLSDTALAVDDVLEIEITATAGGGTIGQGLIATLDIQWES